VLFDIKAKSLEISQVIIEFELKLHCYFFFGTVISYLVFYSFLALFKVVQEFFLEKYIIALFYTF